MEHSPVAVVTGASRGIGRAIAERLAGAGMRVAISARALEPEPGRPGSLAETRDGILAAGGEAVAVRADLAQPADRRRLVEETVGRLGPVDVLVNNAAATWVLPFEEFPEKRWRLMVEVQLRAPYELTQLVVPAMRQRRRGWILNISSRSAVHPSGPPFDELHSGGGWTAYGMCKAGLERFTTALAAELAADDVRVNALAPWANVATPGADARDLVAGFDLEGPEYMAEAALVLCTGDPHLTGRIAYSQPLLAEVGIRPAAGRAGAGSGLPGQPASR